MPGSVSLDFTPADAHLCPAFALRLVRGVHNGASPDWMQRRLRAIGLRPINALVDVTNYITFDRGRPLHVFDAAKVKGALRVRRARAGESVLALDGKTYALDASMVVIADDGGVELIAGIMGGEHSGCDENTRDVLIESALWDPLNIAQTGRKLGIVTDARYRFERGVDPDFCVPGAELATRLIMDLCGGEPSRLVVAGDPTKPRKVVDFPYSEVRRLTGFEIPRAEGEAILLGLGFEVKDGKAIVPNWRPDIDGKADIVEQIVRIAGLDKVPTTPLARLDFGVPKPVLTPLQKRTRLAKRALAALGLREAVTWSFISKPAAVLFGGGAPALALANPIAADLSDMRPSLVPGLAAAAERNARRGLKDVALFEVGQVFLGDGENDQRIAAAALRRGRAKRGGEGRHWTGSGAVDVFDAKGDALALLAALGVAANAVQIVAGGPAFLHPGRSATLQFGPKNIAGWFGELHPSACEALDVEGPLVAFEITLDAIPLAKARPTKAKPRLERSEFMPLERDLAFVVPENARAGDILKAAMAADRALVADADVFDVYRGSGVPDGHKSVAISVILQPRERTLTDFGNRGDNGQNRYRGGQENRSDAALRCARSSSPPRSSSSRALRRHGPRTIRPAPSSRTRSSTTPASPGWDRGRARRSPSPNRPARLPRYAPPPRRAAFARCTPSRPHREPRAGSGWSSRSSRARGARSNRRPVGNTSRRRLQAFLQAFPNLGCFAPSFSKHSFGGFVGFQGVTRLPNPL